MSMLGPPESWATTTSPAAIISTTEMPKCSFHMVCIPTDASLKHSSSLSNGALTTKSTLSATCSPFANARRSRMIASSPSLRLLPSITSRTSAYLTLSFRSNLSRAHNCKAWSFSGRNCPTDRITRCRICTISRALLRPLSPAICKGYVCKCEVLQGGNTFKSSWPQLLFAPAPSPPSRRSCLRAVTLLCHMCLMWASVHELLTNAMSTQCPAPENSAPMTL
mmetsp:Transcript_21876/g.36893  ORF Transcript_21876/g.36893 Transcript_21876/m.36893 type:complete len:222 (+) Transcript_21876:1244-1909(+)